jgi:hypothetical protein
MGLRLSGGGSAMKYVFGIAYLFLAYLFVILGAIAASHGVACMPFMWFFAFMVALCCVQSYRSFEIKDDANPLAGKDREYSIVRAISRTSLVLFLIIFGILALGYVMGQGMWQEGAIFGATIISTLGVGLGMTLFGNLEKSQLDKKV